MSGPARLERSEELCAITERLWVANQQGDLEAIVARKSRMSGLTMFGPVPGEFIDDAEQFARYLRLLFEHDLLAFPQLESQEIDAWVEGSVGWSISRLQVGRSGGQELRVTFVF